MHGKFIDNYKNLYDVNSLASTVHRSSCYIANEISGKWQETLLIKEKLV